MGISRQLSGIVGILFCSISLISFCTIAVSAATLHVPEEYSTIQSAVDAAVDFDTVLINDGTYTGDGNRDIDYHGKAIVVTSVNGATSTIIDCQADSTNPHRGFIFHSGEDSLSILQGLTIQNGFAPGNVDSGQSNGGGILCDSGSSPTIGKCILTQNRVLNSGGGIAVFNSSPIIESCAITRGSALNRSPNVIAGLGGGIRLVNSTSRIKKCLISENIGNTGGGISCNNANAEFDSCTIGNNTAQWFGGFDPAVAGVGGGIHMYMSSPLLQNCQIYRNIATTLFGVLIDNGKGGGHIFIFRSQLSATVI